MTNTTPIRAIPTRYAGRLFRSRTEARWAVFFDELGVEWEYEVQGFETSHGRYLPDFYLPQMTLGNGPSGTWFEAKNDEYTLGETGDEWPKWREVSAGTARSFVVAYGMVRPWSNRTWPRWRTPRYYSDGPYISQWEKAHSEMYEMELDVAHTIDVLRFWTDDVGRNEVDPSYDPYECDIDGDYGHMFCICHVCGRVSLERNALGARIDVCDRPVGKYFYDPYRATPYLHNKVVHAYEAALSARFEFGDSGSMLQRRVHRAP